MLPKDPIEDRVAPDLNKQVDKQYGPLNFWIGIAGILVVGFLFATILILAK